MFKKILELFHSIKPQKGPIPEGKIQTFTYYIPAPPKRTSGYREKQFDRLFYQFINRGYKILDIVTQAQSQNEHSGFWFICVVKAKTKQAQSLDFKLTDEDNFDDETIEFNQDLERILSPGQKD